MDYSLRDLIDIPQLAKLLDSLDAVQTMPSAIIDMEGNVLTATAWQDVCTKFHRAHPDTERQCRESDTYFANKLCDKGGHFIYKCPMGLVDTATPIIVEGKHIGNVFTGQLFMEPPNEEAFLDQARRYGFDQIAYLEAVRKVPVFTEEQLRKNLTFLHQLAEMLANEGLKKKRLVEAEEALREANRFNDQVIASAKEGIIVYDTDLRYLVWNPFMEYLSGIKASEVMGKRPEEVFPFLKDTGVIERLKGALAGAVQDPVDFPYYVPGTGKSGWTTDTSVPFRNAKGEIIGVIGTVSEITERKGMEVALLKSEELFRNMATLAPVGVYLTDTAGNCLYANPRWCEMAGLKEEEASGLVWVQGLHPEDRALVLSAWQQTVESEGRWGLEYRFQTAEGKVTWVHGIATPQRNAAGVIVGYVGINSDITERKQAETVLRDTMQRLQLATASAHMGVWDWDLQAGTMTWDDRMFELYGATREEIQGTVQDWIDGLHPEDRDRAIAESEAALRGEAPFNTAFRVKHKDGTILWCKADALVLRDEQGSPLRMIGLNCDITEQRDAQEQILHLNEELEQRVLDRTAQLEAANKEMEAFSYSVSHDLRAPLRGIDGFSQALVEDYQDRLDETGKNYISRIRSGTQRMGQIIEDLLKLSRVSRIEPSKVKIDLSSLCRKIVDELTQVTPERRVEVSIQGGLTVWADRQLLHMALGNLLGNSWKYTSKSQDPRIEVGETTSPSGERVFFIRDNGAGFDMAHADKLFNAFHRLHSTNEFEGTGIGLSIVQRIILRHGGRIWAEAEPGKGATFFFTLPDRGEA